MANRGASAAFLTELAKDFNHPVHLLETGLDSGPYYLTDAYTDIVWSGNTYVASGHLLGFGDIEEQTRMESYDLTVTYSIVDVTYVSLVLSEDYIGRSIKIHLALLPDGSSTPIVDPILYYDGLINGGSIIEDGAGGATLAITSNGFDMNRRNGRHTNHEENQILFPGDKGFEFVDQATREMIWGQPTPTRNSTDKP